MPIYEYTCTHCGAVFEYLARRLSDRPTACPTCGSEALKKNFSSFAAEVKGSAACPHEHACGHTHGPGCGCCCH